MSATTAHLIYALAWLTFGLGHSLLARESAKARLRPMLGAAYRLAYNVFATLHIAAVYAVGAWAFRGQGEFAVIEPWGLMFTAVHIVGWIGLLIALRGYDLGRLAGTRQIRNARLGISEPEDEPLRRDGLHRFVRHPLYSAAFLILWGAADDPLAVATALWGSVYLVVGSHFEERFLERLYGDAYADYRRRVPAFVPWKGRAI